MSTSSVLVPGSVQRYTRSERGITLECGAVHIMVSILTPRIVRIRMARAGAFAPRRSWSAACADDEFPVTPFDVQETPATLLLKTEVLHVQIERASCRIAFVDAAGTVFCADETGMQIGTPAEAALFVDLSVTGDPAQRVSCVKRIESGEHFFGFGERTGLLNKLGRPLLNWTTDPAFDEGHGIGTDPLYLAIPVFMALRPGLGYGVFFNNSWRSRFSVAWDQPGIWSMEAEGGELDYYVIYGPTPAAITEGIGALLGTMPLPPRWALGHHQSRWGYDTEGQVRELAANFRSRSIPCDVIHLDIEYMQGYRVFTWNNERFPDPAHLLADLRRDGFHVVTIIDPGVKIDPDYHVYQDGLARDMFIRSADGAVFRGYVWPGAAVFSDYTRADVRQWWGDLQKTLIDQGVSGIWNDMNEPAVFDRDFAEGIGYVGTIALDAVQGADGERTTHAEVHNYYGSGMAQAAYEGLQRHLNNERPFVLTRSGFAGIQRWSACWMGDNNSCWEHLEMTMPQLMNMGLSGVPSVGTDIGGFFGHSNGELLARWIQLGALVPFCRNHANRGTAQQEAWVFGPEVESIYREYVQLRYQLLPYLYTLFWDAAQRGTPVLRPLLFHFPDDPVTYHIHDQVLLGEFIMAAPVYQPQRTCRVVYFPAGEWFDWWTGERITGETWAMAQAPLERMPLYVRAGAIIPSGPVMAYADERPLDRLTLDLYPGNGTLTLYEDDGHTFDYQQGQCCTTHMTLRLEEDNTLLMFTLGARTGMYQPPPRELVIRLHAAEERAGSGIPDARYDADRRVLTIQLADDGLEHSWRFRLG